MICSEKFSLNYLLIRFYVNLIYFLIVNFVILYLIYLFILNYTMVKAKSVLFNFIYLFIMQLII